MLHKLNEIKMELEEAVCCELKNGLENVDCHELGEAIDMIKDIASAMKDISIVNGMEEEYGDDERYYTEHSRYGRKPDRDRYRNRMPDRSDHRMTPEMYRDMDYDYLRDIDRDRYGRMYYTELDKRPKDHQTDDGGEYPDYRAGRSWKNRRTYMETKAAHTGNTTADKQLKMQELERYMNELSSDITEMIMDASNEEKTMLKQKLETLKNKI